MAGRAAGVLINQDTLRRCQGLSDPVPGVRVMQAMREIQI